MVSPFFIKFVFRVLNCKTGARRGIKVHSSVYMVPSSFSFIRISNGNESLIYLALVN